MKKIADDWLEVIIYAVFMIALLAAAIAFIFLQAGESDILLSCRS